MDVNLEKLPQVIYACFVLHNFCELNKEYINEESIQRSITMDRELQPETVTNRFYTDKNEAEGKRVRKVLTKYFDPLEHGSYMYDCNNCIKIINDNH